MNNQQIVKLRELDAKFDKLSNWDWEPRTDTFKLMKEVRLFIKETLR